MLHSSPARVPASRRACRLRQSFRCRGKSEQAYLAAAKNEAQRQLFPPGPTGRPMHRSMGDLIILGNRISQAAYNERGNVYMRRILLAAMRLTHSSATIFARSRSAGPPEGCGSSYCERSARARFQPLQGFLHSDRIGMGSGGNAKISGTARLLGHHQAKQTDPPAGTSVEQMVSALGLEPRTY